MKNIWINPDALYLVDTKIVHLSGLLECPKRTVYPKRKSVAVLEIRNHFFELEQMSQIGLPLGKELPIREKEKEFIDVTTFRKFPYEKDFHFKTRNLKSLRKAYREYQIRLGEVSVFGIQKLYQGKITFCELETSKKKDEIEQILSEITQSILEIDTFFLQLEDGSFLLLNEFLEGFPLKGSWIRRFAKIEFDPIQELPLTELKEISLSRLEKEKKKCLQFPKITI